MRIFPAIGLVLLAACAPSKGASSSVCRPPACLPSTSTYAVEIVGIGDDTLPASEFTAVALDSTTGNLTINLPVPAQVTGHVLASALPVPGTVVFSRPSRIPGRADVSYQASADANGAYSLELPPNLDGETYTVRFRPTDTSSFVPYAASATIARSQTLDLVLPTGVGLLTLHGALTDAVKVPVTGARVVMRDGVTQTDQSSTAITDDDGKFVISVPSSAASTSGALVLRIQRGDATSGLLTVSVQLSPSQLGNAVTQADFMQLQLPALPAASHLTFTVMGAGSNGTMKPVAGASVRLTTALAAFAGVGTQSVFHEVDGQTAVDGTLVADLYSNSAQTRTYLVTVVPPADSDFQSTTQSVTVSKASGYTQPITLGLRPIATGRVVGPDHMPLKGALLSPSASFVTTSTATSTAKPGSATTDGDGRFALHVDAAEYDLGLSPPARATLPRTWVPRQLVTTDLDLGDLSLPDPVTFDALVRSSDQAPVAATVRLYLVPAADPTCDAATSSCTPTPLLQAEGATGKDGKASLLLPAD